MTAESPIRDSVVRSSIPQQACSTQNASNAIENPTARKEINKQVIRRKLARQRHCVIEQAVSPSYLDSLFPKLLELFEPQLVNYNGGIAGVKRWKISCYLEVMPGGVPTTSPNIQLLEHFSPLLHVCDDLFRHWYRQQHACNDDQVDGELLVRRQMTFVTRYTPNPGEEALLKVCLDTELYILSD